MVSIQHAETYAAVDLGSNSFHLLVARRDHGELRVIDRIKETVRLGGGLDHDGHLEAETRDRALACLGRFEQRLRGLPADNIRAVGTQTFRRMKNANAFLVVAETALNCGIDIIGGREEARLIYLGVSQGVSGHDEQRLVIDIGGGSTEIVIGKGPEPIELESIQYGCVSLTRRFFPDGKLTERRWRKAIDTVMAELQELRLRYLATGWETAIGSSGTVLAITDICQQLGWVEKDLDAISVRRLRDRLLASGTIANVHLPGLSEDRHPVLAGGLVMLAACFNIFELRTMKASAFALREGMLHDLFGRLDERDPRDKTVQGFCLRHDVDLEQVARVKATALRAARNIGQQVFLQPIHLKLLAWAADLHEVGLAVSHSHYQEHSGYLVQNSDMPGFTQQEQLFIATLVRHQRRPIAQGFGRALPVRLHDPLRFVLLCLRLACVLCRTRDDRAIPEFSLAASDRALVITLPELWQQSHPLTMADLREEIIQLHPTGLKLSIATGSPGVDA